MWTYKPQWSCAAPIRRRKNRLFLAAQEDGSNERPQLRCTAGANVAGVRRRVLRPVDMPQQQSGMLNAVLA